MSEDSFSIEHDVDRSGLAGHRALAQSAAVSTLKSSTFVKEGSGPNRSMERVHNDETVDLAREPFEIAEELRRPKPRSRYFSCKLLLQGGANMKAQFLGVLTSMVILAAVPALAHHPFS